MRISDWSSDVCSSDLLDERCREEATESDVDDEATLDDLDHRTGDDAVIFLDLLHVAPRALVLRTLLGQDEATFLVLLLENQRLDVVADVDDLVGVDVVLDGKLARGDDTLGLVRSEEHTSELQSLMRISYAVFCLKKKKTTMHLRTSN